MQSVQSFVERLREESYRLHGLHIGDLSVRSSLSITYDELREQHPARPRAFRLLGVIAGSPTPTSVVAALLECSLEEAHDILEQLVGDQLLERVEDSRYMLHDLIRIFARERSDTEDSKADREAALSRVIYLYRRVPNLAEGVDFLNVAREWAMQSRWDRVADICIASLDVSDAMRQYVLDSPGQGKGERQHDLSRLACLGAFAYIQMNRLRVASILVERQGACKIGDL